MEQKLEAILFYKNEPVEIKKLAGILSVSPEEVRAGLDNLQKSLEGRGVCLILTDSEASLSTAAQMTTLVEQIAKDEMSKEIGKAGLETLAIILYNNGATRKDIDYIRGVNSTFILRNLSIRGLIDKIENPKDTRSFLYKPSINLLAHMGMTKIEELPQFAEFKDKINELRNEQSHQNE